MIHGERASDGATGARLRVYTGGCHCGSVRFEVDAPESLEVLDCNCSICRRVGYLHLIVPGERFRLLSGEAALRTYTFGTQTARHLFCETCGIKSFYVPRSHPDGISVNARCLDPDPARTLRVTPFDGAHWEESAADLAPLPQGSDVEWRPRPLVRRPRLRPPPGSASGRGCAD